jgi:hypothetical protein
VGDAAQVVVYERDEPLERILLSRGAPRQQDRDL